MENQRDTFLFEMLNHTRPMLKNMVRSTPLDVDDLLQEAACAILTSFDRIQAAEHPHRYAVRVVQYAALQYLHKQHFTVSLDEPRGDDEDSTTLADTLAAPDGQTPQDFTLTDQRAAALHASLRRLALDEQQFMRERFALNAYNPVPHWNDGKVCRQSTRKPGTVSTSAYRHLRADQELAQALAFA